MNRRIMSSTLLLALACAVATAAEHSPTVAKKYDVNGHGALTVMAPAAWKESVRQPPPGLPFGPTVRFTDATGKQFKVLLSIIPVPPDKANVVSKAALKQAAEKMRDHFLSGAKETHVEIKELKGDHVMGYYFTVTDKAPQPGSFECMTPVVAAVGDLMLSTTILHHDHDAPERDAALAMVKSAEQAGK